MVDEDGRPKSLYLTADAPRISPGIPLDLLPVERRFSAISAWRAGWQWYSVQNPLNPDIRNALNIKQRNTLNFMQHKKLTRLPARWLRPRKSWPDH